MADKYKYRSIPIIIMVNKSDLYPNPDLRIKVDGNKNQPVLATAARTGQGLTELRQALIDCAPDDFINAPSIIGDLVVLVVPIDKEAPKGRLILPQVQTLRDLLDNDAGGVVVGEETLISVLENLKQPPSMVGTDSQESFKKWLMIRRLRSK